MLKYVYHSLLLIDLEVMLISDRLSLSADIGNCCNVVTLAT